MEQEAFQLQMRRLASDETAGKAKALPWKERLKAYQKVKALDIVMQNCFGLGLAHLAAPTEEELKEQVDQGKPCKIPSFAMDEASSSYSCVWWLAFQRDICIVPAPGPSHRISNAVKLAVSATGMWGHVLLAGLAFGLPHGTWEQASGLE